MNYRNQILTGDALAVLKTLESESVQMICTSPPYYGLRNYNTEPLIWDGLPDCEHVWNALPEKRNRWSGDKDASEKQTSNRGSAWIIPQGEFCLRCNGWRGHLGLEPTPFLYIDHLVQIFREARRVLRRDGTLWLNLGDSYVGYKGDLYNQHQRRGTGEHSPVPMRHDLGTPHTSGLSAKNLMMIPARVAIALQEDGWILRSDIIWEKTNCLSGGTMVYARTQKGDMPMTIKDLVRLRPETVKLWNGQQWTQVLAWIQNPRPDNPIELELRSGQRIGCTPEHIWPTQRGNVRADELKIGDAIQTCQLSGPCNPLVPLMLPDTIGWFVGIYLAEGSRSGDCIQIAGHSKEVDRYNRLCSIAANYGGTCCKHNIGGNSTTVNLHGKVLNAIIDTYISGHDAKDKHLSPVCWKRSNGFLQSALEGYLDGDGSYDEANNRWRIGFTRNYNLETDLRTVCARLGVSLRLKPTLSTNGVTGKSHASFKGEIRFTKSNHHSNKDGGEIVRIGRSRARQFWDITVADEPHLFALASGILTHNCMPESVTDRPTTSHEHVFLFTKQPRYYYDADAIREPHTTANLLYEMSKTSKWGHKKLLTNKANIADYQDETHCYHPAGRNKRSVWSIPTTPFSAESIGIDDVDHFAVMPEKLVEICVLAGSSPRACEICHAPWQRVTERVQFGKAHSDTAYTDEKMQATRLSGSRQAYRALGLEGPPAPVTIGWRPTCTCANEGTGKCVVLDPFSGAGTVALVASQMSRDWIGIDLNPNYRRLAMKRIETIQPDMWEAEAVS